MYLKGLFRNISMTSSFSQPYLNDIIIKYEICNDILDTSLINIKLNLQLWNLVNVDIVYLMYKYLYDHILWCKMRGLYNHIV